MMAGILSDLGQMFSMDDATSRQGLTNLFQDDPNSGFLDKAAEQGKKRNLERLVAEQAAAKQAAAAQQASNISSGGINPQGAKLPFAPGPSSTRTLDQFGTANQYGYKPSAPDYGINFAQSIPTNIGSPAQPVPVEQMGVFEGFQKHGAMGGLQGLLGFGQNNNMGVDAKGNPIPLSQIPGAEGASSYSNQNVQDMQGGLGETLGNLVPDSLKDSLSNFKSGYDNLSKEDAEAMISAFQQATAKPEATPFASIKPSGASAGYRIPVENLYNRGLLKI
tara:strand:+ start:1343 stop:2173 length:831 start_codon:yes stop_codon:yes gene_type:complete